MSPFYALVISKGRRVLGADPKLLKLKVCMYLDLDAAIYLHFPYFVIGNTVEMW